MALLFLFGVILLTYVFTGSFAAMLFSILILIIGKKYCNTCSPHIRTQAEKVFYITLIVYLILAIIRSSDIAIPDAINDSLFKSGGDEDDFYEKTQIAAKQSFSGLLNINSILLSYFGPLAISCVGYNYYFSFIAFFAENVLDGNAVIVQLLGSVLPASLLSVVIFKTIALYVRKEKALRYALFSSLCTPFVYYSVCLLRDIHVAFLFSLIIYLVLLPYKKKNLCRIVLIILLIASFRVWSALFASLFVVYYIYRQYKQKKGVIVVLSFFLLVIAAAMAFSVMDSVQERLAMLSRNVEYKVVDNSSYLTRIFALPTPIKELVIILSSYFTPFTAWNELSSDFNLYHNIFKLTIVVYEFFSFFVVWLFLKWIFVNKGLKELHESLIVLLVMVFAYFFFSASEFTVRRTMCMFPIIYLSYINIRDNRITTKQYMRDIIPPFVFYAIGFVVFVI